MSDQAGQFRPNFRQLKRYQGLAVVFCVCFGLTVTALEHSRPEAIKAVCHPIFVVLETYFTPIRNVSMHGRDFSRQVEKMWEVEEDYQALERRLMLAEAKLQDARETIRGLERISGLRQWKSPDELEFVLADVVSFSTEDRMAEWIINRGRLDGLELGLPVVGQKGLAGVIREVSDRTARVQALTDPVSAVGVADANRRDRGIVFGRGREARLEFVPENESRPMVEGALLITSGFADSVYPKGLIVGRIVAAKFNDYGVKYGVVEPAEKFSALEEVLVIRRVHRSVQPLADAMGIYSLEMPMAPADETGSSDRTEAEEPNGAERPTADAEDPGGNKEPDRAGGSAAEAKVHSRDEEPNGAEDSANDAEDKGGETSTRSDEERP